MIEKQAKPDNQGGRQLQIESSLKKTISQMIGFMVVGTFGVVINGLVFWFLSQFEILKGVLFPYWMFQECTIAWRIGILVAFVFNFVFNKWLVFKA